MEDATLTTQAALLYPATPDLTFDELLTEINTFLTRRGEQALERSETAGGAGGEMFSRKETLDLIQAYYQLGERPRRRLLDLAKSLHTEGDAIA